MTSLDTNIVLRFLLNDVPAQTKVAAELIESTKVYVTDVVVVETIFVLEKTMLIPRKDLVDLIADFFGFNNVVHNQFFLLEAIGLYAAHPSLSIVDCYAATESKSYSNKLVTFDKRLANQGGTHVTELR